MLGTVRETSALPFHRFFVLGALLGACSSSSEATGSGVPGGTVGSGGSESSGGASSGAGGRVANGGAPAGSGGNGSGATTSRSGTTGSGGASAGGVSATGGASGFTCRTNFDCPQTDCFGCPPIVCIDGMCVQEARGSGGAAGASGSGGTGGVLPCGNTTCRSGEICVEQRCGGGPLQCTPARDGGTCPVGFQFSACPGFASGGCVPQCDPPPPYCAAVSASCAASISAATGCSCADSICKWGQCHVASGRNVTCDAQ